jgi:hypothetical protein
MLDAEPDGPIEEGGMLIRMVPVPMSVFEKR